MGPVQAMQAGMLLVERVDPSGTRQPLATPDLHSMNTRELSDCAVTFQGDPVGIIAGRKHAGFLYHGIYGNSMKPGTPAVAFLETFMEGVSAVERGREHDSPYYALRRYAKGR